MTIDKTISINLKTGSYEDALNSIVRELEKENSATLFHVWVTVLPTVEKHLAMRH